MRFAICSVAHRLGPEAAGEETSHVRFPRPHALCARSRRGKFTVNVRTMKKQLRRGLKAIAAGGLSGSIVELVDSLYHTLLELCGESHLRNPLRGNLHGGVGERALVLPWWT